MSQKLIKQLLPATPAIATGSLFGGGVNVRYEEWSKTSKCYRPKQVECADTAEATQLVEYLKVCQLLEPLIRYLTGLEHQYYHNVGSRERWQRVKGCKDNFAILLLPQNQTCQRLAEFMLTAGGKQFSEAIPQRKEATYYQKGQDLLIEIRLFVKLHHPRYQAKNVAA